MKQRIALLSDTVDDAKAVVSTLRSHKIDDEDIYVVTEQDVILEDLPEADPRQYSDLIPAAKRGAGIGGALGLFGGLLMATVPPAGLAFGGAAIGAVTAGGAAFGAWASSLVGISVPNTQLEEFQTAVQNGATLVLADVEEGRAEEIMQSVASICRGEVVQSDTVDAV